MTDSTAKRSFSVRLDPALIARLDAVCRSRVVGRRLIVRIALEDLLTRLEADPPPEEEP